jgi:hypothetical protein
MGEWRYSSTIPDLGTRWRKLVIFTPQPLYSRGNNSLGAYWIGVWVAPQPVWTLWNREKISYPAVNRTPAAQLIAYCCTELESSNIR